jgi:hypothetical protein
MIPGFYGFFQSFVRGLKSVVRRLGIVPSAELRLCFVAMIPNFHYFHSVYHPSESPSYTPKPEDERCTTRSEAMMIENSPACFGEAR